MLMPINIPSEIIFDSWNGFVFLRFIALMMSILASFAQAESQSAS